MKTSNRSWQLTALIALALCIGAGAVGKGSGMAAHSFQDHVQDRAAGHALQVREAANVVGLVVQAGITRGQTLRFDVFLFPSSCHVAPGPENLQLTLLAPQGNVVARSALQRSPNQQAETVHLDFNADQFPQQLFDNRGRLELTAVLRSVNPGPPHSAIPGPHVVAEVFDNISGKTAAHIAGTPLLGCATGQH